MPVISEPVRTLRRDAQARREALMSAAEACFHEHGYNVPLEMVAERAGVGRGTLYRNFADREALALAIFEREIDRLEAAIDVDQPIDRTIAMMVRQGTRASALFMRIAAEIRHDADRLTLFRGLGRRLEDVLTPAVTQAHRRGDLAADVSAADLMLAMKMTGGLIYPSMTAAEQDAQIAAGLGLLVRGLRPR
jgi:AcrR family transcriptional regulator